MKKNIAVMYNALTDSGLPDEHDVLDQVHAVCRAIEQLGGHAIKVPCTLNLEDLASRLRHLNPQRVFNLVESLDGHGRLIHLVPSLLESLGLAYTGCPAGAILLSSHKVMAKERLRAAGLPTPEWINPVPEDLPWTGGWQGQGGRTASGSRRQWILKSLWEHASFGLEQDNLVTGSVDEVWQLMAHRAPSLGNACFAEVFVDGREFNLSILEYNGTPKVLPPAEICFSGFGDRPKIVGYRAKWMPEAEEYSSTHRCFDFDPVDAPLLAQLSDLALKCWHLFGLKGYARVDFRVDGQGCPFILEINANPCISRDAGFPAALEKSGISFHEAMGHILGWASRQPLSGIHFRYEPVAADVQGIEELVRQTGFFRPDEIDIARELVQERLEKGAASSYSFVLACEGNRVIGYGCYGLIPCTSTSYDIYWIAVLPEFQSKGLGKKILEDMQQCILSSGGRQVYVETSTKAQYASSRAFYKRCGYACKVVLEDFYESGDGKAIYNKVL